MINKFKILTLFAGLFISASSQATPQDPFPYYRYKYGNVEYTSKSSAISAAKTDKITEDIHYFKLNGERKINYKHYISGTSGSIKGFGYKPYFTTPTVLADVKSYEALESHIVNYEMNYQLCTISATAQVVNPNPSVSNIFDIFVTVTKGQKILDENNQFACNNENTHTDEKTIRGNFDWEPYGSWLIEVVDRNKPQAQSCDTAVGNPCNVFTGNKFETKVDYDNKYLPFERHYNSQQGDNSVSEIGNGWSHTYYGRIDTMDGILTSHSNFYYYDEKNHKHYFQHKWAGSYLNKYSSNVSMNKIGNEYITTDGQTIKYFDTTTGLLKRIQEPTHIINIERDSENRILKAVNNFGEEIVFNYNQPKTHIISVSLPNGNTIQYGQDTLGNLITATDQDNDVETYHYEDPNYYAFLTGITDKKGIRYATWTYDSQGRAYSSTHADGFDAVTIASSRTQTTNSKGGVTNYSRTVHYSTDIPKLRFKSTSETQTGSRSLDSYGNSDITLRYTTPLGLRIDNTIEDISVINQSIYKDTNNGNVELKRENFDYADFNVKVYSETFQDTGFDIAVGRKLRKLTKDNYSIEYSFNEYMNPVLVTYTDLTEHTVPYSTNGRVRQMAMAYYDNNLLKAIDGARKDVNDFTFIDYDSMGNVSQVKNAMCHDVATIDDYVPTLTENVGCQKTQFLNYTANRMPQTIIDINGISRNLSYDNDNKINSVTINYSTGAVTTTYAYDDVDLLDRVTFPDGSWLDYDYNDARYLEKITNNLGESIEFALDTEGMITQRTIKSDTGTIVNQQNSVWSVNNLLRQSISGEGYLTTYDYDIMGNLNSITDHLGNVVTMDIDALERVTKEVDALSGEVTRTYDKSDNIVSITDQRGNTTYYTVDGFNQTIRVNSPDTGIEDYWYDDAGNNTQTVNAKTTVTRTFDILNRLSTVSYPDSTLNEVYSYDNGSYGKGRMTGVTYKHGSVSYTFNEYGQVDVKTEIINAVPYITDYDYDNLGRLDSVTYPSGTIVSYVRDSLGRVSGMNYQFDSNDTVKSLVSNIQYLPFGGVKSYTLGNGVTYTGSFDLDYQVTNVTYNNGISDIFNETYGYEMLNQLNTITDNLNVLNNQSFVFNEKKELTQAIGAYGQIDYDYDAVGNRTQKITDLVNIEDYIIDPNSNRLTTVNADTLSQTFTYDGVGNMITDNGFDSVIDTLTYSDSNRLTAFNSIFYGYNPLGQRVIENGKVNQYSGSDLIFVEDGSKTVEYIYLGNVKLAMIEKDGLGDSIYYAINNYMGLPRAFTDNIGNTIWSAQFKPFGEIYDEYGSVSNLTRFIGQYDNIESEYFYNYFRDYAPALGRYIQSDPIGLNAGVNTYTYVLNNPVNYVDPLGLDVSLEYNNSAGITSFPSTTHQNIGVLGGTRYSFGIMENGSMSSNSDKMPTKNSNGDGEVYVDKNKNSLHIEHNKILKTNNIMDINVNNILTNMVGFRGDYGLYDNTCIEFSEKMFDFFRVNQQLLSYDIYTTDELMYIYNEHFNLK